MRIPSVGSLYNARLSRSGLGSVSRSPQMSFSQQYSAALSNASPAAKGFFDMTIQPATDTAPAQETNLPSLSPLVSGFSSARVAGASTPPLFIPASQIGAYGVPGTTLGEKASAYGQKFVGLPYIYGGTSLTTGADCSGFVMAVYRHLGYDMPRSLFSQAETGTTVDYRSLNDLKPGDLLFFKHDDNTTISHVTMYIGDGKIVHASSPETGIIITKLQGNWERNLMRVKRIG